MTEHEARRRLKNLRRERRWSFDALYADMRAVLGMERLSPPTLRRFEQGRGHPHPFTLADVTDYLTKQNSTAA